MEIIVIEVCDRMKLGGRSIADLFVCLFDIYR